MEIYKTFAIDAAHRLPNVPVGHKCGRLHGHTFRIEVHVCAPLDAKGGWVVDFADLAKAFSPLHEVLDHNYLNDIPGLENPTSENLAAWVWQQLKPALPILTKVVVQESPSSGAVYQGQGD